MNSGDIVLLPRKLTAENGAKALLIGEFHEIVTSTCCNCMGEGAIEFEDGNKYMCDECGGIGEYIYKVHVTWTTIKRIYNMIVEKMEIKNEG